MSDTLPAPNPECLPHPPEEAVSSTKLYDSSKVLSVSVPQFPHLYSEDNYGPHLLLLLWGFRELLVEILSR